MINVTDVKHDPKGYRREESLADVARVLNGYGDIVALRHSRVGAAKEFAQFSRVPVINAGDGIGPGSEHPTQALLDVYTIRKELGQVDGVSVLLLG